jgi:hypothetical protein
MQGNVAGQLGAPVAQFLVLVAQDQTRTDEVTKNLVGLMGDLCNVYKQSVRDLMGNQFLIDVVKEALQSEERDVKETARWALGELQQVNELYHR